METESSSPSSKEPAAGPYLNNGTNNMTKRRIPTKSNNSLKGN
jgi:hypothetical protein